MNKTKSLSACSHPKKDCTSCHGGMCIALEDTDFGGKECPFYMDRQTTKKRLDETRSRLLEKGFVIRRTS